MIRYYKLFNLMKRKGMKKTDLLEIMSPSTLAKLSKGKVVQTDIIDKICLFLRCQTEDIMEVFEEIGTGENPNEIMVVKNILKEDNTSKKHVYTLQKNEPSNEKDNIKLQNEIIKKQQFIDEIIDIVSKKYKDYIDKE